MMFATHHSNAFFMNAPEVFRSFGFMKHLLQPVFPDMEFYLGCEVMCSKSEMKDVVDALEDGRLPRMNDSRYVLVEFDEEVFMDTVFFVPRYYWEKDGFRFWPTGKDISTK